MASTTSDLQLLGRKLGALDYNPDLYVKEIARRSVGGHDLLHQRNNIKVIFFTWGKIFYYLKRVIRFKIIYDSSSRGEITSKKSSSFLRGPIFLDYYILI